MLKRLKPKQLCYISLILSCFFLLTYFSHYYAGLRLVEFLLGAIVECLFFPTVLLVLPVAFYLSLKHVIKDKWSPKTYSFYAFVILLLNLILVWGSLIHTYL